MRPGIRNGALPIPWRENLRLVDLEPYFSTEDGILTLAKSDHTLCELSEPVSPLAQSIDFLDTNDVDGRRVYMRSLSFVFVKAVADCYPEYHAYVEHMISGCLYCTLRKDGAIVQPDSAVKNRIRARMRELVAADLPIRRETVTVDEALARFEAAGRRAKVRILQHRRSRTLSIYHLDGYADHFYGFMCPSTGRLSVFDLELYRMGLVLVGIERHSRTMVKNFRPQYKLSDIYTENEHWSSLQGISTVPDLNDRIQNGDIQEVIEISEQLQLEKIMDLADEIQRNHKRVVFVAAPSASGKTSFAHKLRIALRTLGLRPLALSLDDYFVPRDKTPLDENGQPDYESIEALDLPQFQKDLQTLLVGGSVPRLRFDFQKGCSASTGELLSVGSNDPLIIEGIHGLNPQLTGLFPESEQFRIYLSVITHVNLDDHNRIPTSDLRLMRRMARDIRTRGKTPQRTIETWGSVRRGEEQNIFPYQEEAHALFNSSFLYEISVLRPIIEPLLQKISPEEPAFTEASRILSILQYFEPIRDTSAIAPTSILREFIGGSLITVS